MPLCRQNVQRNPWDDYCTLLLFGQWELYTVVIGKKQ